MNKLQWNLNRNSNIFIQENAFESVVCETAAILSRPQYVNLNDAILKIKLTYQQWSVIVVKSVSADGLSKLLGHLQA